MPNEGAIIQDLTWSIGPAIDDPCRPQNPKTSALFARQFSQTLGPI